MSEKGMGFMDMRSMQFAHDLKMPIQLIYSCVQLLEMELSPNARAEGYLQMLMKSADQLNSMVRSALNADETCEARMRIRDVVAQARSVSRQCAAYAGERGVQLHFETNAARFLMPMDGEKLERILHNLLSNALRFTNEGGHVSVGVQVLGDAVEFSVADDGCGIPPEMQEAVFQPGVSTGGTGYGLSIVREYAHALGGEVYLKSGPGRGCRFIVRLPVLKTEQP